MSNHVPEGPVMRDGMPAYVGQLVEYDGDIYTYEGRNRGTIMMVLRSQDGERFVVHPHFCECADADAA